MKIIHTKEKFDCYDCGYITDTVEYFVDHKRGCSGIEKSTDIKNIDSLGMSISHLDTILEQIDCGYAISPSSAIHTARAMLKDIKYNLSGVFKNE